MNSVKGDFFSFFPNGNGDALKISFALWQVRKKILPCVCIGIAGQREVKVGLVAIAFFSVFYLILIVFIPHPVGTAPMLVSDCVD